MKLRETGSDGLVVNPFEVWKGTTIPTLGLARYLGFETGKKDQHAVDQAHEAEAIAEAIKRVLAEVREMVKSLELPKPYHDWEGFSVCTQAILEKLEGMVKP